MTCFYCEGMSQRAMARALKTSRKTIEKYFLENSLIAKKNNKQNLDKGKIVTTYVQFDELETFEHTKRKPLGVQVSIRAKTGEIISAKVVSNSFGKTLKKNVVQNVESKSTITTDEHKGYIGLNKEYYHHTINHSIGEYVLFNEITTNGIESVWALMKRGYKGTYHHWSRKHLHRYLNEFAFRLGEGNVKHSTLDRVGSLIQNSNRRLDYKTLTK